MSRVCKKCKGEGIIDVYHMMMEITCPNCRGKKNIEYEECSACEIKPQEGSCDMCWKDKVED